MIIKNAARVGKTKMRRDAVRIFETGLAAINTKAVIRNAVHRAGDIIRVGRKKYDLKKFDHLYVIGFGKASLAAGEELEKILGSKITGGVILDTELGRLKRIKSLAGTHPLPTERNVRAAGEIMEIIERADSRDLILTIISGGGSALLCRPYGLTCAGLSLITGALMRAGATICEMNTVRKHLSEILGGQFARLAYPATICGLVFSDIPGDDISMIASGPTVLDKTTVLDAARILAKYDVIKTCRLPNCDLRETPKDAIYFKKVHNELIAGNSLAIAAMKREARRLGYRPAVLDEQIYGEAREVGQFLASNVKAGEAIIAGGETTVTVSGRGRGGRNQEVALGALACVRPGTLVASCASDGIDNGTLFAGAVADELTQATAKRKKLDPAVFLRENNSLAFTKKAGNGILTGKTGANVSDLFLALGEK